VRKHIQAIASCVVLPLALLFALFGESLQSVGQAANVRIQLDHKSLVFSPGEPLSLGVGLADFHAQPGTLVRCTVEAIKVADGTSTWNATQEQQVNEAGVLPDFELFRQKTPSVEGAFQLEIKLTIRPDGSAAPLKQIFMKRLPLLVAAQEKKSGDQPTVMPADPEKTEPNTNTEDLLAVWNEPGDFSRKIGLEKRTGSAPEFDWNHIFNQCTGFVSELEANGYSTVAIPTRFAVTGLYPTGNAAPANPTAMAKADVLELLMRRFDQSGSDVYLVVPGQEAKVANPTEGTEKLSTSVPLLVLEQTEFGSYALPYNSMRHQIPSCVWQDVKRVEELYSEHDSFKAIVIDCRGCSAKMISQTTLTRCLAIPLVDAAVNTKEQFNNRLSVAIASTCPEVIFVSHLPDDGGLPPAFVGIGKPVSGLTSLLKAVRKDIDSLTIHSSTTHLENLGFEVFSDGKLSEWDMHLADGATLQIDKTHFREGTQSIHLCNSSPDHSISLRSKSFQFHPTRRIAVEAWVRLEPEVDAPSVRLVLEGEYQGQRFRHQVELSDNPHLAKAGKKQGEWTPLNLQIDELPREGISNLRVAIDVNGEGNVWVDNLQLGDMWLTAEEYQEFIAAFETAEQRLAAGRTDDVQLYLTTTLPNQLAKFAEVSYLAPSLVQAAPIASPVMTELTTAPTVKAPVQQVSVTKMSSVTDSDITPIPVEDESGDTFVSDFEPAEKPPTIAQRMAAKVKKSELVSMFGQLIDKEMTGQKQTESASTISENKGGVNTTAVVTTKPINPSLNSDPDIVADSKLAIAETRTGAPWWKFWESAGQDLDGTKETQIGERSSTPGELPPRVPVARQDGDIPRTIKEVPDTPKSTWRSLWTSLWRSPQDEPSTAETPEATPVTPEITPAVESVVATETTIDTDEDGHRRQGFFWFKHRENETGKSDLSEVTSNDGNFSRFAGLWRLPRFGSNQKNEVLAETAPRVEVGELARATSAAESDLGPATIDPPRSHFFGRFLVRQESPLNEPDSEVAQATSIRSRLWSFFGIGREDQEEQLAASPAAAATPKAVIATRPSIGITTRSTQPEGVPSNGAELGKEKPVINNMRTASPILLR
jgi:hypothetical protein